MSRVSVNTLSNCTRQTAYRRLASRAGGVAVTFALSVFPITMLLGAAVDLGFVTQSRAHLNAAADVAALAAAKAAADAFIAGLPNYVSLGQSAGTQWFGSQGTTVLSTLQPTATVTVMQSGSVFQASVTYQATVSSYFAWVFGYSRIPIAGLSSATITANTYVSITFLLDNSSSMLVAATQAGVTTLGALTPVTGATPGKPRGLTSGSVPDGLGVYRCAFACHWDAGGNDYYGLARANNVQLRFDVVQSAVQAAITEMIHEEVFPSQFSVGIYTFDNNLTQIYANSSDLNGAATAAAAMASPVVPDKANTDFPTIMKALAKNSTAAGNGSTLNTPRKALIIVTDGLADYGTRKIPTTEGPINPADCTAMKNLGYSVYVLYTVFVIPTKPSDLNLVLLNNNALLPYINGTSSPGMAASLQACASSASNYGQASDPAAIVTAMTAMLKSALGNGGRFTY